MAGKRHSPANGCSQVSRRSFLLFTQSSCSSTSWLDPSGLVPPHLHILELPKPSHRQIPKFNLVCFPVSAMNVPDHLFWQFPLLCQSLQSPGCPNISFEQQAWHWTPLCFICALLFIFICIRAHRLHVGPGLFSTTGQWPVCSYFGGINVHTRTASASCTLNVFGLHGRHP